MGRKKVMKKQRRSKNRIEGKSISLLQKAEFGYFVGRDNEEALIFVGLNVTLDWVWI
jgi:hypothetical protein